MSHKTFDKHLAELAVFTKTHEHARVPVRSGPLGGLWRGSGSLPWRGLLNHLLAQSACGW